MVYFTSLSYSYSASTPSLEPSLTFLQLCCRDGTHSLLFFTYNFSFSLFHSSLQTDAQTLGTFPLNSAKRSNEVTIDESANATAPSASDDLEFAEEGDAVFMLTCQLLNMSLHQRPAPIVTNNALPGMHFLSLLLPSFWRPISATLFLKTTNFDYAFKPPPSYLLTLFALQQLSIHLSLQQANHSLYICIFLHDQVFRDGYLVQYRNFI